MFRMQPPIKIMLIVLLLLPLTHESAHAADSYELFLEGNAAAKTRHENATQEQQIEMRHRWSIFNEQYKKLSLEEQHKVNAMRREREERWSRLSENEEADLEERSQEYHSRKTFQNKKGQPN